MEKTRRIVSFRNYCAPLAGDWIRCERRWQVVFPKLSRDTSQITCLRAKVKYVRPRRRQRLWFRLFLLLPAFAARPGFFPLPHNACGRHIFEGDVRSLVCADALGSDAHS